MPLHLSLFGIPMKILVTGGVKSGKSRLAEERCLSLSPDDKPIYLATTENHDPEMQTRIAVHRERRQDRFTTVEEPLALHQTLSQQTAPVLLECMTLWMNNMLYHEKSEQMIFQEVEKLMALPLSLVFVLNEVGMGIIPDNALARQFVDLSGKVAQQLGNGCDEVHFCVAGQALRMK